MSFGITLCDTVFFERFSVNKIWVIIAFTLVFVIWYYVLPNWLLIVLLTMPNWLLIVLLTINVIFIEKNRLHDLVRKSFVCPTKYLEQTFKIWNDIKQDKNKFLQIACQQNLIKLRYVSFLYTSYSGIVCLM